jgi:D-glycero-alpha-D-manno-heptose-7-phosphate kinase
MIISRTPFRISFLGGGTDLPEFYEEEEGAVLSTAIDKYMHITVNDRFDDSFRLSYSKTEITREVDAIEHPIFRHCIKKYHNLQGSEPDRRGLEILSMADVPAGSGLGSSSSFTVGLLHALKAHGGHFQSAEDLASEASEIEIKDLREPIGKQDQYAAAYGGLNLIRFLPSGLVSVEPIICASETRRALEMSVLVLFTGKTRSASGVLAEQRAKTQINRESLRELRQMALQMRNLLQSNQSVQKVGELLHEGWRIKKALAKGISAGDIDQWYERGVLAGASGGKILGAGGGGFLLFLVHPDRRERVRAELRELREMPVRFDPRGSRILLVEH